MTAAEGIPDSGPLLQITVVAILALAVERDDEKVAAFQVLQQFALSLHQAQRPRVMRMNRPASGRDETRHGRNMLAHVKSSTRKDVPGLGTAKGR